MRARSSPLPRSISSIDTSDSENERKKWERNIRRKFESRFFAIVASLCLQNMNMNESDSRSDVHYLGNSENKA